MEEKFSYERAMEELNAIVKRIESGECTIDALSGEVKRAMELIKQCRQRLQKVEADVEKAFE